MTKKGIYILASVGIIILWVLIATSYGKTYESCYETHYPSIEGDTKKFIHVSCKLEKKAKWIQFLNPFNKVVIRGNAFQLFINDGSRFEKTPIKNDFKITEDNKIIHLKSDKDFKTIEVYYLEGWQLKKINRVSHTAPEFPRTTPNIFAYDNNKIYYSWEQKFYLFNLENDNPSIIKDFKNISKGMGLYEYPDFIDQGKGEQKYLPKHKASDYGLIVKDRGGRPIYTRIGTARFVDFFQFSFFKR